MKALSLAFSGIVLCAFQQSALAEGKTDVYLGFSLSSLALDSERVDGVPTRSPGHTPKIGSLVMGLQFNERWAADISMGTDFTNNVDTQQYSLNGYRFFGDKNWKPYVSAGVSTFNVNDAGISGTQQLQAGLGLSGTLSDNLELRLGYQHFFDVTGDSYNDDGVTIGLNWHFGAKAPVVVAQATPQVESVPEQKEVVDSFELLVQFDFDQAEIKSVYIPQVEAIANLMNENPDISIAIEGHTCWLGSEEYNQVLSERRAAAVKTLLINEHGFSEDRIKTEGYGEARPIADNNTKAGREKNRRAITVILKPKVVAE